MRASVSRVSAVLSIFIVLALAAPIAAYAGTNVQNQAGSTSITAGQMTLKSYQSQENAISRNFKQAIAAAKLALRNSLSFAKTPGARSTARVQFTLAVITASTERDSLLVQLGAPPVSSNGLGAASTANGRND
jgi:uncharacterized protein HemX